MFKVWNFQRCLSIIFAILYLQMRFMPQVQIKLKALQK